MVDTIASVPALRDDQVKNALNFLKNPSVSSTPLDKKISFLLEKGLTQAEIDEAVKQYNAGGGTATTTTTPTATTTAPTTTQPPRAPYGYAQPYPQPYPYAPPLHYAPPPPPPPPPSASLGSQILSGLGMVTVGATALLGLSKLFSYLAGGDTTSQAPAITDQPATESKAGESKGPDGYKPATAPEIEMRSLRRQMEDMQRTLRDHNRDTMTLKEMIDKMAKLLADRNAQEKKDIAEMAASKAIEEAYTRLREMSGRSIGGSEDDMKRHKGPSMNATSAEMIMGPEPEKPKELYEDKKPLFDAIKRIKRANSNDVIEKATNMLRRMIQNLIDDGENLRNRRMPCGNTIYKSTLLDCKGHGDLLKAVGFTKNDSGSGARSWEFSEPDTDEGKEFQRAFLKLAVKKLKELKEEVAPTKPTRGTNFNNSAGMNSQQYGGTNFNNSRSPGMNKQQYGGYGANQTYGSNAPPTYGMPAPTYGGAGGFQPGASSGFPAARGPYGSPYGAAPSVQPEAPKPSARSTSPIIEEIPPQKETKVTSTSAETPNKPKSTPAPAAAKPAAASAPKADTSTKTESTPKKDILDIDD